MADGYYELIGLVPASSDFTPQRAVEHFSGLTFSRYRDQQWVFRKEPVRAEVLSGGPAPYSTGFLGPWSVVAWLDASEEAAQDNRDRSEESGLPSPSGYNCRLPGPSIHPVGRGRPRLR